MKIQYVILPSLALGAAVALFLPAKSEAWSTIGGSLSTSQRDFRVFNNFSDAAANNNVTPDANFPGWQGADMAIWKASVEWGSRLHGTGAGDPGQVNGLGSGGANFDAVWAGSTTGSGNTNNNIHSELAGGSGGVLAFTETPISDGWRILYYSSWTWQDGPNTNVGSGGNIDLQGVACHEYGHALGLGHSAVNGATMFPSISGNGNAQRSLAADDTAGVQAIYGVASGSKPIISGIVVGAGVVTINGSGFGATNNQVWFTSNVDTATGVADPVVKSANTNSNGTTLTVPVPANAGPGDVFVKLSTSGNSTLSNGWPFDPLATPPCPSISSFCTAAPNSFDAGGAEIGTTGSQSVLTNDLHLLVTSVPPNKLGLFFYGQDMSAFTAFGNGFRCIASPFFRLPSTMSNLFGDVDFTLNHQNLPLGGQILPGQTWGFQFWYRDPDAGGANFNASNGASVPFCP